MSREPVLVGKYNREKDGALGAWLQMFRDSLVLRVELGDRVFDALVQENVQLRNMKVLARLNSSTSSRPYVVGNK